MALLQKEYRHIDQNRDRHGRLRYYFRIGKGKRIKLDGAFGSHEFDESYEAARKSYGLPSPGEKRVRPRTVHDLCARFYQSYDFKRLKPLTQRNYRRQIEMFRAVLGDHMVRAIRRSAFAQIKADMADRPGACRTLLKRLKTLFAFAVGELEWIESNPLDAVKLPAEGEGFLPWSDEDIEIYLNHWGPGTRERLGLFLCLYTAQRRSDIVKMGRQHLRDDTISVVQGKTGSRVWIPLHSRLKEELAHVPADQMLFLVNPLNGAQLSSEGFGNWIRKNAKAPMRPEAYPDEPKADRQLIPGTRGPHGLRKAACRGLIEAGCDAEMAIAISGHASGEELEPYIRDVNKKLKAKQAMERWDVTQKGLGK